MAQRTVVHWHRAGLPSLWPGLDPGALSRISIHTQQRASAQAGSQQRMQRCPAATLQFRASFKKPPLGIEPRSSA